MDSVPLMPTVFKNTCNIIRKIEFMVKNLNWDEIFYIICTCKLDIYEFQLSRVNILKVMCPCKYSFVCTLSKYADKTLTKKPQAADCDW